MDQGSSNVVGSPSADPAAAVRQERVRTVFAAVAQLSPEARDAFLDQACAADPSLRVDVEAMLRSNASTAVFVYPMPAGRLPAGKELASRFRIVRFIASGGMSDVYEAEDMQLGEHVALKTVKPQILGDSHTLSRFKREIQYAKRITHPNVCRIHDLGSHREGDSEIVFLTMQLLQGETLDSRLRTVGRMSTDEARPLLIQITEALIAAHDTGIIHRDLKTSNVMLVSASADLKAVITDFGLARVSGASDDTSLTEIGRIVGTPAYMAPEQLVRGELTPATDIYALGLVMYEMVTGRRPFQGKPGSDSIIKRLSEAPTPPSEHGFDIDSRWDQLILRCLERDPAKRFQSADQLMRALEATSLAAHGEAPLAAVSRMKEIAAKTRVRVSVLVVLGAVIVAIVLGVWVFGRHRPSAAAQRWYSEGTRALRDGTSFTAMNALQRAVEIDPEFPLAHARLAEAATDLDYMDKAKSEMLRASPALQSFSLSTEEKLRLEAVYFVLVRDFSQAAAKYQQLSEKVPKVEKAAVLVDLGRAYESGGKFPEALAKYSESITLDDQVAGAFLRRAVLEGKQQQNDKAAADFDAADKLYQVAGDVEGITEVLFQRSSLLRRTGKLAEARTPAEKALEMARNSRDEYHQIRALLMLSYLQYNTGEIEASQKGAQEAIDLARRAGIETLAASGLVDLGTALLNKGDHAAAEPYLRSALETAKRFEAVRVEARAELSLGQVLVKTGRTQEGFGLSKLAIEHFEQAGDKSNAARAAIPAARLLRDQGDFDAAARLFRDQLKLAEEVKDDGGIAFAAEGLGSVLLLRQEYPEALANFDRSERVGRATGDLNMEAFSAVSRADALRSLGRLTEAAQSLEKAELLEQKLNGNKPLLASVNFSRAELHLSLLSFADVEQDVRKMMNAAGPGVLEASGKRLLGLQRVRTGRQREGLDLCQAALDLGKTFHNIPLLKNSEMALAEAKLASGDRAGALALASGLAEYFGRLGQHESELRALGLAVSASQGAQRTRYIENAKASIVKLRMQLGDAFGGFASRPDIRLIVQR